MAAEVSYSFEFRREFRGETRCPGNCAAKARFGTRLAEYLSLRT